MATVKVFDQFNEESGEIELPAEVFGVEPKPEILHLVVRAQMAKKRAGTHSTKTRAKVSGGGNKPWKQKGTGRARSGSNRSPVWRGGAIVFGPSPRNYEFKVNSKVRSLALRMALSSKVAEDLIVVNEIKLPEPKTGFVAQMTEALSIVDALLVIPEPNVELERACKNLPYVKMISADKLNVLDVLKYRQLVLLQDSVQAIAKRFAAKEA